jgi:hypothetical protein
MPQRVATAIEPTVWLPPTPAETPIASQAPNMPCHAVNITAPPARLAVAVVNPAVTVIAPPATVSPSPTVIVIPPPAPVVAALVDTTTSPLTPLRGVEVRVGVFVMGERVSVLVGRIIMSAILLEIQVNIVRVMAIRQGESVGVLINQSINRPVDINQGSIRPINQPINQSINRQPTNQPTSQPTSQPINQ